MCRLQTPQLEEALKDYPLYSQDGKGKEAICRAIFALGATRWFILEGEQEGGDTIMFGIVTGLIEDEYGYVSLNELSEVELDFSAQGFRTNYPRLSDLLVIHSLIEIIRKTIGIQQGKPILLQAERRGVRF